ncbi:Protein kinase [Reticulomyxa filosa]|uniref:Protein kinase n=1 Tax=Reticulomyxa filosa TaxID=46433 RepID=X6LDS8_RETFI|nr:Protein kinase [Reticulomyxa filosa]|eukprot:ETN99286.1 Protein kinase [Reticulomyxa filosa]
MILFCEKIGLLIKYDEEKNAFEFFDLPICDNIKKYNKYAYLHFNNYIFLFGGYHVDINVNISISRLIYKYIINEKIWTKMNQELPLCLADSIALLNKNYIYIIGGSNESFTLYFNFFYPRGKNFQQLFLYMLFKSFI